MSWALFKRNIVLPFKTGSENHNLNCQFLQRKSRRAANKIIYIIAKYFQAKSQLPLSPLKHVHSVMHGCFLPCEALIL